MATPFPDGNKKFRSFPRTRPFVRSVLHETKTNFFSRNRGRLDSIRKVCALRRFLTAHPVYNAALKVRLRAGSAKDNKRSRSELCGWRKFEKMKYRLNVVCQSVNIYIYISRASMHLCILSWSGYSVRWFFSFDFRFEKREKNFSRLSRKFFSTYVSTLSRFGDERKRDMYRHLSGSTLIFSNLSDYWYKIGREKLEKELVRFQLKIGYSGS